MFNVIETATGLYSTFESFDTKADAQLWIDARNFLVPSRISIVASADLVAAENDQLVALERAWEV